MEKSCEKDWIGRDGKVISLTVVWGLVDHELRGLGFQQGYCSLFRGLVSWMVSWLGLECHWLPSRGLYCLDYVLSWRSSNWDILGDVVFGVKCSWHEQIDNRDIVPTYTTDFHVSLPRAKQYDHHFCFRNAVRIGTRTLSVSFARNSTKAACTSASPRRPILSFLYVEIVIDL